MKEEKHWKRKPSMVYQHKKYIFSPGQRLKQKSTFKRCVRPSCTTLEDEFDEMSNSFLHGTTAIHGGSEKKHRWNKTIAVKRLKVGSVDSPPHGKIMNGFSRFPAWSNRLRVQ